MLGPWFGGVRATVHTVCVGAGMCRGEKYAVEDTAEAVESAAEVRPGSVQNQNTPMTLGTPTYGHFQHP